MPIVNPILVGAVSALFIGFGIVLAFNHWTGGDSGSDASVYTIVAITSVPFMLIWATVAYYALKEGWHSAWCGVETHTAVQEN